MRRIHATGAMALTVLAVAAAPALADSGRGAGGVDAVPVSSPTTTLAHTATVRRAVTARTGPSARSARRMVVRPTTEFAGTVTTLLVTRSTVRDGERWLEVLLPRRPNGSRGWVPAHAVDVGSTPHRITVDLSDRELTLYRSDRVIMRAPVAIGASGTPTPTGRFAVTERVRTRTPGAFLGPVVLPLTGFSRTLNEFAGGDGRVALHGTSLPALIGTRASHGCVRLRNADIVRLASHVRAGTPVIIRP